MRDGCIFCKIVAGQIPVTPLFENKVAICIPDKNPIAPEHGLVIAKEHFGNLGDLDPIDNEQILPGMFDLVDDFVSRRGINNDGYRIVINNGDDAGQTVQHLHIHVIGGAALKNDFGA
jgi:histidine triad (HIT) family protein